MSLNRKYFQLVRHFGARDHMTANPNPTVAVIHYLNHRKVVLVAMANAALLPPHTLTNQRTSLACIVKVNAYAHAAFSGRAAPVDAAQKAAADGDPDAMDDWPAVELHPLCEALAAAVSDKRPLLPYRPSL
jgi:hypothetical protein